ncbi:MAG: ImmA/IrrE family metallo-endopeptidase [Methylovulum sp.]|nr:ImmA/IrrE family metallo-endopeptidase [Methylovulum sp.]
MNRLTVAELLLQELGITEPEEIDLDAIAWHVGATIKRRKLDGCEARIVGTGKKAIITVNTASALVRQQFSIGHEIGHWYHHRGRSLICRSEEIGKHCNGGAVLERQADAFAADLLLPNYILQPRLPQFKKLTFDVIKQVAKDFTTSIPATAIRLIEKGDWPSILICHGQTGRKWFARNTSVPDSWFPKDELHPESYAIGILYGNDTDQASPRKMKAHIWFNRRDASNYELQEQSIRTMDGDVLSLLLFK